MVVLDNTGLVEHIKMLKWHKILLILPSLMGAFLLFTLCGLIPNILANNGYSVLAFSLRFLIIPLTPLYIWFLNEQINQVELKQVIGKTRTLFQSFIFGFSIGIAVVFLSELLLFFTSDFSFHLNDSISIPKTIGIILTSLIVAYFEELIFRGFVFITLLKTTNKFLISVIVSSLLFSILHFQGFTGSSIFLYHCNIFLGGILLCFVFLLTKSIWAAIGFHFSFNSLNNIDLFYLNDKQEVTDKAMSEQILVYQTLLLLIIIIVIITLFHKYFTPPLSFFKSESE